MPDLGAILSLVNYGTAIAVNLFTLAGDLFSLAAPYIPH